MGVSSILERGFLPLSDPLRRLPSQYLAWEQVAAELPKLLVAGGARRDLEQLPMLDPDGLEDEGQWERAMLLLSYFGHAYVWGESPPAGALPPSLAVPWYHVGQHLRRPPVLSYASYGLHNWRRLDPTLPVALGNIVLQQNFLGGLDEEWFVLVHVEIEAEAEPALRAIPEAQAAASRTLLEPLETHLGTMAATLSQMYDTLLRMPEGCDPHIYYRRVRPYIHGWKNNPALPHGVVYTGVDAWEGQPQQFRGETGAQSSIIPSFDAALGIDHQADPLLPYLLEMRNYMPAPHRDYLEAVSKGPSIRDAVMAHREARRSLRDVYNECLHLLADFRSKHLEYAARYIQMQSRTGAANPTDIGTGGTPFMPYLRKHRDETLEHRIA